MECLPTPDPRSYNAPSSMTYTQQHLDEAAAIIGKLDVESIERTAGLLAALRERLHAVYGTKAKVSVLSDPSGFQVSFMIPRMQSEEADDE